jgi:hypothetical protein
MWEKTAINEFEILSLMEDERQIQNYFWVIV